MSKLVDILARELKEWGFRAGTSYFCIDGTAGWISRAEWQAAVDALAKPAVWNGEGLPPVGTTCIFYPGSPEGSDWHRELRRGVHVDVIAHFDSNGSSTAVFTFKVNGGLQVEQAISGCFKPIRTPEQIAADEIQAIRDELGWKRPQLGACPVEQLYRLGRIKPKSSGGAS